MGRAVVCPIPGETVGHDASRVAFLFLPQA